MYKKILILVIFLCFISVQTSFALSAQSAILIDGHTGRVLLEHNAYQKRGMASTTKIMTAIVAIESGKLNDIVTVSSTAAGVEGSSMWLKSGEKISVESLLYGLMLNSGNDAATALAEYIGGDIPHFAQMMTNKAQALGLKNTSFTNPHGLDNENHYTTAYDLAQITRYALNNEKFAEIVSTKTKKVEWADNEWERSLHNHNKMLTMYQGADGVKTGFTKKCGRCLVSSATRDNLKLIAVTLNAPNDWQDHSEMLDFGFSKYNYKKVISKGDYMKTLPVLNGVTDNISLYASADVELAITDKEESSIKTVYNIPENVEAPIEMDEKIGYADVFLGDKLVAKVDLFCGSTVSINVQSNFWTKLNYLILNLLSSFANNI